MRRLLLLAIKDKNVQTQNVKAQGAYSIYGSPKN